MANKQRTYPWSGWPPASQQRFFKMALFGLAGAFFAVFIGLNLFTGAQDLAIEEAKEQYGRVVPLVHDINALRASRGDLAHLPPIEAVERIVDDRNLDDYVDSMRTTRLDEDTEGVQLTISGLTLIMLTDFLEDMRDRASLQTPDFTLTRNAEDPRLADVHLVLAR